MKTWKIVLLIIGAIVLLIALDFGFGFLGVFKTKTVGKAQQNVQREVFEQTQSYVEGKRQIALKYYKEYLQADDDSKKALKSIVSQDFANFDEDKYLTGELRNFIHNCKYNP